MNEAEYEQALTARAEEMMAASHAIICERNAHAPSDQQTPLPPWEEFVDLAAAELEPAFSDQTATPNGPAAVDPNP